MQQINLPLFLISTGLNSQKLYMRLIKRLNSEKVNLKMETRISIWYIWIVDPSKMSVSPSFQIDTRLNSKNQYIKLRFKMNSATLMCICLPGFPIGLLDILTLRKWGFCLCFISMHDYWIPNTRNSLVHNS